MVKTVVGYAATNAQAPLAPFKFQRRDVGPCDIELQILYCGVCHSDIHTARNEWRGTTYPVVPGHEILGKITHIGAQVTQFKVGDIVAVGCLVDSCRECHACKTGLEQYCHQTPTFTYNSPDPHLGTKTYGGYSTSIVVDHNYVLHVPKQFKEAQFPNVAPLLCAGITTYSPLKHWNVGKNTRVGIVGLGGLGHMGIKLAHALGAHVTLFTTSPHKIEDAKRMGADEVVVSKDIDALKKQKNSLDFILNTVSAPHSLDTYVQLLRLDGTMCLVGAPETPHPPTNVSFLIAQRRSIGGSHIGGIQETQEMLDFCAAHHVTCDIEMISIEQINSAYERMLKSDVKYRFVIDMASLLHST